MKLIRPIEVTDAVLASSNVPETVPSVWASGTTYAAGATVSVAGAANAFDVYQSLQASNVGHAPASSPTWWEKLCTLYGAWASGTSYNLGDFVTRTTTNVHSVYQSAVASNVGHDPLTDTGTNWTLVGSDNRWAMFDAVVQSQATRADQIAVTLNVPGRIDTVALLNIAGISARVTLTDAVEGVVYDETRNLVSSSGITDWYGYFFEPIERLTDCLFDDLPPYAAPTLAVTISETGQTVACGVMIAGLSRDLGGTQYGAQTGITDYSVKQADDFGNYQIVKRAFANRATFQVWVDNGLVDAAQRLLASYRATPTLYVGDDDYAATMVFGFYKDFTLTISYPDVSVLAIELEGLT